MKKKVLIAVGNKSYSTILVETFEKHSHEFSLSSHEVLHRRYLEEIIGLEKPNVLVIHDYYLESDLNDSEQKEQELLRLFRKVRVNYDDSLRIVFLCERPKGDPFLSMLVSIGILDIFNSNSFDLDNFIEQLSDKPRFSRVEKFLLATSNTQMPSYELEELGEESEFEDEAETEDEEAEGNPSVTGVQPVQKIIEKKVIQKVINKNVIKRNYQVQITNSTEKIVGIPIKKKLIMIGSPISRSGSTFIAHLLGRAISQLGINVTYVESPFSRAYTYDRFSGHHFTQDYRSKFYQFNKTIEPKWESVYDWNKDGVDLVCKHPTSEPNYTEDDIPFENLIKVLFSSESTVTIMDVGTDWQFELYQDVFDIADHVFYIVEPDIPFLQYFEESNDLSVQFLRNQLEHDKSVLIGNRFDKRILKNSLIKDLYNQQLAGFFPSFPDDDVYNAQFEGVFLNDYKDYKSKVEQYVAPLLNKILPSELLKKHRKKDGLFRGGFLNKKIKIEKTYIEGD